LRLFLICLSFAALREILASLVAATPLCAPLRMFFGALSLIMDLLPIVILAGGLATRLRPITEKIPKSLVEVAGRPFLEHQLNLLCLNQITEVILCVGHLGEKIEAEFGDGSKYGMRIRYSYDGSNLLGTGGAVRNALPLLPDSFFILYGDTYLLIDYQSIAQAFTGCGRRALMTVFANQDAWDQSNVWFEQGEIRLYSKRSRLPKMRHIDYGLSICSRTLFEVLPDSQPFDLASLFEDLSKRQELAGFEVFQRFYEIGSHRGLEELDRLLRLNQGEANRRSN
jgi:NDP-sugar pyrophosphorylase family protein